MPGVAHGLFSRGGADLVFYFYADCNRRLADQLAAEVKAQKQAEEGAQPPEPRFVDYYTGQPHYNTPYYNVVFNINSHVMTSKLIIML